MQTDRLRFHTTSLQGVTCIESSEFRIQIDEADNCRGEATIYWKVDNAYNRTLNALRCLLRYKFLPLWLEESERLDVLAELDANDYDTIQTQLTKFVDNVY